MSGQLGSSVTDLDALDAGLAQILGAINTQFLPGIDRIKAGLNNPGANPNCAVGSATTSPADDCGVQQAVAFFKLSIPVLVDSITANVSQTLLGRISVPAAGCDPDAPTLICGAKTMVGGSRDLKAGTEKLLAGSGELGAGGEKLYDKLGELASGLKKIDNGAGRLSDGTGELDTGARPARGGCR